MTESGPKSGIRGVVEGVKGKIKEVAGNATGNDRLEREGEAQQDKAAHAREVAEHEAKAELSRTKADADEARQRAAQESR